MIRFFLLFINIIFWATLLSIIKPSVLAAPPTNFQTTQVIGSGLSSPTGFEFAPDGRIFILQRTGEVKIFKNGQLLAQNFAVLPAVTTGDRGLIGITFDPNFNSNHYVYFYYTGVDKKNYIVRFNAQGDVGTDGPHTLYKTPFPSDLLHVGGSIRFGLDGTLFFAVGDNGYPPHGQDLTNPYGKILRIKKDGSIPSDNPFYGQGDKLPEIWAYGFRNPWRFQVDSETGRLYGGDVGDYTWEEINHIKKGKNYGWPRCEGNCSTAGMINPIHAYNHNSQSSSVTGGPVYRGRMFPEGYFGSLFFGDYAQGFIKRIKLDANGNFISVHNFDSNAGSVVDLKVAPDGSLYYITYYPGRLYRVAYTPDNHAPIANATADVKKGMEPLTVHFSSAGSNDPDGDPIGYIWTFGDGTSSRAANPVKIYREKGRYTVQLSVSDGENTVKAIPIVIQVGLQPKITISAPTDGQLYKAGDRITYNISAVDGAGFDIDDRSIQTEIIFHHHTHTHPFVGPLTGRTGTFTIPTTGEPAANTWYEIKAKATDDNGLVAVKSVFIYPKKVTLTFKTSPLNLRIFLDGSPLSATETLEAVVGFKRQIHAPALQNTGNKIYQYDHWSDGLGQKHFIITPNTDKTYTAFFKETTTFKGEYFSNKSLSGSPVLTRMDTAINFDWVHGSPHPSVPNDNFSARWTKKHVFNAGTYNFTLRADDGVRLYVDNQRIIDQWRDQPATTYTASRTLTAGVHDIKMEFYDHTLFAVAKLSWGLTTESSDLDLETSNSIFETTPTPIASPSSIP